MVLQRSRPVRVSGVAAPGASISGTFRGATASAIADGRGEWELTFPAGPEGGPFDLAVSDGCGGAATLRDVLVGELWFCSGQSNMEYPVGRDGPFWGLPDGAAVAAAGDAGIRLFQVPHTVSPEAVQSEPPLGLKWRSGADSSAVAEGSAVAWFFGLALRRELGPNVPVGLVHASWGGTRIEPWISRKAFEQAGFADEVRAIDEAIVDEAIRKKKSGSAPEQERSLDGKLARLRTWLRDCYFATDPQTTAEALHSWAAPKLPPEEEAKWSRGRRGNLGTLARPGVGWFRKEFVLPQTWVGKKAALTAAYVNDCDEMFIDGVKIGETGIETPNWWAVPRRYVFTVPDTPSGRHVLAARVQNHFATGYFRGALTVTLDGDESGDPLEIRIGDDDWLERLEFTVDPTKAGIRPPVDDSPSPYHSQQLPSTLFNAMVAPFKPIAFRGAIWYQGCSNRDNPEPYARLQDLLVRCWRDAFREPDLVFIGTQLAAFKEHCPEQRLPDDWWRALTPGESVTDISFVPIRSAQERLLDKPGCGLACTIDVGDHSDIHPSRKRAVGERLAHEAMRLAYGRADALPGPRAEAARREAGAAVRVTFWDCPGGLEMRAEGAERPRSANVGAAEHLFALRDAHGGRLLWADARIESDGSVLVSSPDVTDPDLVQYAWSDFPPAADLRRRSDGIPVFPFSLSVS